MSVPLRWVSAQKRDELIHHVKTLLQGRPEILAALLHGSLLESSHVHDVDIALVLNPQQVDPMRFRDDELDLGVRLSEAVEIPVDVRILNDAPVAFRYHALKGIVLINRDPERLDEMRAGTWDEYFDFAPFAREYLREVLGG